MGPTKAEGEGERAEKREEQVKSMQVVTNLSSLKQNEDWQKKKRNKTKQTKKPW